METPETIKFPPGLIHCERTFISSFWSQICQWGHDSSEQVSMSQTLNSLIAWASESLCWVAVCWKRTRMTHFSSKAPNESGCHSSNKDVPRMLNPRPLGSSIMFANKQQHAHMALPLTVPVLEILIPLSYLLLHSHNFYCRPETDCWQMPGLPGPTMIPGDIIELFPMPVVVTRKDWKM